MKAIKRASVVFTVILLFFFLGQVKPLSVDASIGQCSITIYSIKNSDGNYTSATGDCQSHVQGHFSGGASRIIIDGVDVGSISSGTVLNISGAKQSNYSLSINTVYEEAKPEPVTKPEPKPEPKPEKVPKPNPEPKPENKPPVKTPEVKKELKTERKPDPKPKEEKEEISLLLPKENEEPNIDKEEIEVAEKPEEILEEEKNEESEIEVEEEKEEVVYSIDQLIKMMEKKEIKGEVKDGKYFVVFEDDKENQEVTKEEAIKLGIIEEEEKKEKEEVPIEAVEDLKDEKASDAKGDKGKMPFIISMLGLIVVLAGAFMYFIQWRKSVKK